MSSAKLKFDLTQGVIDVEGSEDFVLTIYRDFKDKLDQMRAHNPAKSAHEQKIQVPKQAPTGSDTSKSTGSQTKPKKKSGTQTPSIVKSLDLSGGGKCERLKDYYALFDTKTNFERNLIFVYYLQHKLEISGITCDHVFTCYRDIGVKVPGALRQSLLDTSSRRGWLDTSNTEDIGVSIPGVNFLEHDLQRKVSTS